MPRVPFEVLPAHGRLWVFPASRTLTDVEARACLEAVDEFLASWAAHGVLLKAGRELREGRFLLVGVDVDAEAPSGCSIDAFVEPPEGFRRRAPRHADRPRARLVSRRDRDPDPVARRVPGSRGGRRNRTRRARVRHEPNTCGASSGGRARAASNRDLARSGFLQGPDPDLRERHPDQSLPGFGVTLQQVTGGPSLPNGWGVYILEYMLSREAPNPISRLRVLVLDSA